MMAASLGKMVESQAPKDGLGTREDGLARLLDGKRGAGRCPEEWQDPGKDGNLMALREAEAGPEKELRSLWFK